jgi:hypothetical protein
MLCTYSSYLACALYCNTFICTYFHLFLDLQSYKFCSILLLCCKLGPTQDVSEPGPSSRRGTTICSNLYLLTCLRLLEQLQCDFSRILTYLPSGLFGSYGTGCGQVILEECVLLSLPCWTGCLGRSSCTRIAIGRTIVFSLSRRGRVW